MVSDPHVARVTGSCELSNICAANCIVALYMSSIYSQSRSHLSSPDTVSSPLRTPFQQPNEIDTIANFIWSAKEQKQPE